MNIDEHEANLLSSLLFKKLEFMKKDELFWDGEYLVTCPICEKSYCYDLKDDELGDNDNITETEAFDICVSKLKHKKDCNREELVKLFNKIESFVAKKNKEV